MSRCFIIQPFDKGPYDKRYDDIFAPAVKRAGLEPYRVDRDPGVDIPIDTIELEIRNSTMCLADITSDNPNVWYELGYAHANGKDVVMVCSTERTRFPFDIQHRTIITYKSESSQDFRKLGDEITKRTKALLLKQRQIQTISSLSPLKETEGLSQYEVVALISVMERVRTIDGEVYVDLILEDMRNAGFTDLASSLSIEGLVRKQMIKNQKAQGFPRHFEITEKGIDWLMNNQVNLKLKDE